ncbi:MAG: universal stress protein [Nesterenkonia sp.]|uniref:universal stress protein n=1 Tax=Nesterenkonia marinintestina TaxID=2979865 RepID=UPI0021BE1FB2|nr:universal stress protein [Nesterenkonia sp. GX14115]MDO5492889.1 universal stress protein [Nesterenkonia sp.]
MNESSQSPAAPRGGRVRRFGVVVGVDGSEQSLRAAHWAAAEAHRRELPLTVVTAYSLPAFAASSMDGGYAMVDESALQAGGEDVVGQAKEFLRDYPGEVTYHVEGGDAAGVLLDYSSEADVIVVGGRGRGGFLGRLLGSVSSAIPAHAECPTVVVPLKYSSQESNAVTTSTGAIPVINPDGTVDDHAQASDSDRRPAPPKFSATCSGRDTRPVAVGVDGSDYGRLAALAAAREAVQRGTRLRLVCALPPLGATLVWIPAHVDDQAAVDELTEKLEAGRRWLRSHYPELDIEIDVADGTAADVMVEETRHAQLTVVGTRGRGGFAGMLLGSTSQAVLHHAEGPLMVVPEAKDRRLDDRADFGPVLGS